MGKNLGRASTQTVLSLGGIRAPVALYKTVADPKESKWDTAGPNGGPLYYEQVATEAAVEETAEGSPLEVQEAPAEPRASAPGEFKRVLMEEGSGQVVEPEDVRRGVRTEHAGFLDLTDQLEEIGLATQLEEMDVRAFIRVEQVPRERVTGAYFLAAQEPTSAKVLRILYEAMREKRRVAVVKWTKRTRQALGVLVPYPRSGALLTLELSWAGHQKEPSGAALAHQQAKVTDGEVAAAGALIEALSTSRDVLDEARDDAERLREELLEKARAGELEEFRTPERPAEEEAADLEAALTASVERAADADPIPF